MVVLQDISYIHANKDVLFENIHLTINKKDKIAIVGNNGVGKSTLLKIISGQLDPLVGSVFVDTSPYYVPQLTGQYNDVTIAETLGISGKLNALMQILSGNTTNELLEIVGDDWSIEDRCSEALAHWGLEGLNLTQPMNTLSGGEKIKVFLAGISLHEPSLVLMDEPSNHLDSESRMLLYDYVQSTSATLIVVSHDRILLNLLDAICELDKHGLISYGGSYEFYTEQKRIENNALSLDIKSKEKALRKAKEVERETMERKQKLDARGKKKQEKAGLPTISMKTFKDNAEKSTARTKDIHHEKISSVSQELNQLRNELTGRDKIKFNFDSSNLHVGKLLISARDINILFNEQKLWKQGVNIDIKSGERIALCGNNGSGKTTLIKILLGQMQASEGSVHRMMDHAIYIDQEYSLINTSTPIYEQALQFNITGMQEHEIKIRLNRFLFGKDVWDKRCDTLSGGEKMRLMLCCLTILNRAPDIIVLDEPTNNLDIQNVEILTNAINDYKGTLLVISHDVTFVEQIGVVRLIEMN